jgi:hypothetical protein
MRRLTIAGLIAALTFGTFALVASIVVASAQTRPTYWPPTKGAPVMTEPYSDIPWHQKLGTYAGNEIDEALVLPYAALPAENVLIVRIRWVRSQQEQPAKPGKHAA